MIPSPTTGRLGRRRLSGRLRPVRRILYEAVASIRHQTQRPDGQRAVEPGAMDPLRPHIGAALRAHRSAASTRASAERGCLLRGGDRAPRIVGEFLLLQCRLRFARWPVGLGTTDAHCAQVRDMEEDCTSLCAHYQPINNYQLATGRTNESGFTLAPNWQLLGRTTICGMPLSCS